MVVYDDSVLVDFQASIIHLPNANAPYVLIVVDGADQHLGICVRVPFRGWDVFQDGFK